MQLSPITDKIWSAFVFAYKIFGLQSGLAEGLLFYSCVQDLPNQPDLWLDECPYLQPSLSSRVPAGVRVELVATEAETVRPTARAPRNTRSSFALAS